MTTRAEFLKKAGLIATAPYFLGARRSQRRRKMRKNVLVILTDDQEPNTVNVMERTVARMVENGTKFMQGQVVIPQCGPSRVSMLTGQYVHNHGCIDNTSLGGTWDQFRPKERDCLPVWLNDSGVVTAFFGKYLNGYGSNGATGETELTRFVPPGWDRFIGWQGGYNQHGDQYKVNDQGDLKTYDRRELHDTDYLTQKAEGFIRNRQGAPAPWFCMVSLNAPHGPSFYADRHTGMFSQAEMPRVPSFNEADVSDKPAWIRAQHLLSAAEVEEAEMKWRKRLRALQSVDDMVDSLINAINETGQGEDTYIIFTSDNGYMLWKHRVYSKGAPYKESMGVPFLVKGPGVPRDKKDFSLISNIDLAPTIAEWTGSTIPEVDGYSFAPVFSDPAYRHRERQLVEFYSGHPYYGLRTRDGRLYVEYENGDREYYDLATDPYEVESVHDRLSSQDEMAQLSGQLAELKTCAGSGCRALDN